MYDQGPRVIVCTVVSCKHTGVQVLWAEGRGGGFFFSWYNQVALFTWACLLTEIMFYIGFFLYFSRKFA